jgi:adenylyl-sulfate kinase
MLVPESEREARLREAAELPYIQIREETACWLDLLAIGALAPRVGFDRELALPSDRRCAPGERIAIRDGYNERLAILTVAEDCGGSLSGSVEILQRPRWRGFAALRKTCAEVKTELGARPALAWMVDGLPSVEAEAAVRAACAKAGASPLIQVVTHCAPPDLDLFTRVGAALVPAGRLGAVVQVLSLSSQDAKIRQVIARNCGAAGLVEAPAGGTLSPDVAAIAAPVRPPRNQAGFCVWFTGLPSSGKSSIALELAAMLEERGRRITLLDGDVVRTHLSKGLGFSREDRDTNILRIGWVAAELVRHHAAVICSAVSPYEATRERVRAMVGADRFVLVHVDTPAEVCQARDVKGFYARARAGAIQGFTGADDPYEPPRNPSLRLHTNDISPAENARRVIALLTGAGFL